MAALLMESLKPVAADATEVLIKTFLMTEARAVQIDVQALAEPAASDALAAEIIQVTEDLR